MRVEGSGGRRRALTLPAARRRRPLVREESALEGEAPAEPDERAFRTDDAVAGDEDGDGVSVAGHPDGPRRARPADRPRDLAVGRGLPEGDPPEGRPHRTLEGRAAQIEREAGSPPSAKALRDRLPRGGDRGTILDEPPERKLSAKICEEPTLPLAGESDLHNALRRNGGEVLAIRRPDRPVSDRFHGGLLGRILPPIVFGRDGGLPPTRAPPVTILETSRTAWSLNAPGMTSLLPVLLLLSCQAAERRPDIDQQIRWQRNLEDALAISSAEGRPILVAVNMDGESASERIVRERYRDPAWVALTRPFVCLVASVFRHAPRDHDDSGRRIECPRLGEVTCGEHIALEPILYDRFLGGQRISPRHALVLPSGEKAFDLFLLFDLRELDRKLAEAGTKAPPPGPADPPAFLPGDFTLNIEEHRRLRLEQASARRHRDRLAFESRFPVFFSSSTEDVMVAALRNAGEAGALEALRLVLGGMRWMDLRWVQAASDAGLAAGATRILREQIERPDRARARSPYWHCLLRPLARLDGKSPGTRSLLLSFLVAGHEDQRSAAAAAWDDACGEKARKDLAAAIDSAGGRVDLAAILLLAQADEEGGAGPEPPEELPSAEALEEELREVEGALRERPDDAALQARLGRASLALARRRMESKGSETQLLLSDAERSLARASAADPGDLSLLLDRARTAFHLGKFEEQERLALEVLELLPPLSAETFKAVRGFPELTSGSHHWDEREAVHALYLPRLRVAREALATPKERLEAYRWLGDAAARLLSVRSGSDPRLEVEGLLRGARSLSLAVAARGSDETDWRSLSSWFGALGRRSEEIEVLEAGIERFPESQTLHTAFGDAFRNLGRIQEWAEAAAQVGRRHPTSGTSAWYEGFARLIHAEWLRRGEEPDEAIQAYEKAEEAFVRGLGLRPEFAGSAAHYLALAALGKGFAHLLADRRAEAAACLPQAAATRLPLAQIRDGLDRDVFDLLEGALEWRESGASPVDPLALLDSLEKADPGNPFWARAIADGELREALRADGRDEPAEGDRYLRISIEAARRALAIGDTVENRRPLAQSATIFAERLLERGSVTEARGFLAEAAPLLDERAPAADASPAELTELAKNLRGRLGAARPAFRRGR